MRCIALSLDGKKRLIGRPGLKDKYDIYREGFGVKVWRFGKKGVFL